MKTVSISLPEITKEVDIAFAKIQLFSDGIMVVTIKGLDEIDIEKSKKIIETIGEIGNGKKFPTLVKAEQFAAPTPEARTFLAKSESNPYSSAGAYMVKTLAERIMVNAYLLYNKPVRPTRIFTSETKALDWLKTFI